MSQAGFNCHTNLNFITGTTWIKIFDQHRRFRFINMDTNVSGTFQLSSQPLVPEKEHITVTYTTLFTSLTVF